LSACESDNPGGIRTRVSARITSSLLLVCGYTIGSGEKLSATKTREADFGDRMGQRAGKRVLMLSKVLHSKRGSQEVMGHLTPETV
jgi:hypothetical protein